MSHVRDRRLTEAVLAFLVASALLGALALLPAGLGGPTADAQATAPAATTAGPAIELNMAATVNDAVSPPAGQINSGDTITHTFTVKNAGDVRLDDLSVVDPDTDGVECVKTTLTPGESTTCTSKTTVRIQQAHIDAGVIKSRKARAAAYSPSPERTQVDDTAAATTIIPTDEEITFTKERSGPKVAVKAGDPIYFLFTLSNPGNVVLLEVSVDDPSVSRVNCLQDFILPGRTLTCTATYTVTQADIAAGVIENTAKVSAKTSNKKTVAASDSVSVSVSGSASGSATSGRLAGPNRYSTAVEISKATFGPGVDAVYIATGVNFPDALAGSAASGGDGPILLATKGAVGGATLTELRRLKPKRIIVLGGTGAVSAAVESTLKKHAPTTRQAGADRYSTAAAISAGHFQPGAATAFVATGEDFPDALAGGPAAAKLGGPILLTQRDRLPSATVSELRRLKPKRIVVLGGTGVVSTAVENALKGYTPGKVSRLAGADRYSTGRAISQNAFGPGVPVAYVATGANFPDALAGGAAGAFKNGPVLLVAGAAIPKATKDELARLQPKRIIVLGGTAVVPKATQDALGAYVR